LPELQLRYLIALEHYSALLILLCDPGFVNVNSFVLFVATRVEALTCKIEN